MVSNPLDASGTRLVVPPMISLLRMTTMPYPKRHLAQASRPAPLYVVLSRYLADSSVTWHSRPANSRKSRKTRRKPTASISHPPPSPRGVWFTCPRDAKLNSFSDAFAKGPEAKITYPTSGTLTTPKMTLSNLHAGAGDAILDAKPL
jgi:hypothetical protein